MLLRDGSLIGPGDHSSPLAPVRLRRLYVLCTGSSDVVLRGRKLVGAFCNIDRLLLVLARMHDQERRTQAQGGQDLTSRGSNTADRGSAQSFTQPLHRRLRTFSGAKETRAEPTDVFHSKLSSTRRSGRTRLRSVCRRAVA
jgi:hypothetical protein